VLSRAWTNRILGAVEKYNIFPRVLGFVPLHNPSCRTSLGKVPVLAGRQAGQQRSTIPIPFLFVTPRLMKHWLLFLPSICLLLPSAAYAQLGLKVGGNLSGFTTSTSNGYRTSTNDKLSYQVGIFYNQSLTKRLSFIPEAQYSSERMTIRRTFAYDPSFSAIYASNFSYLSIPFLLRATWSRFYLEAGPQAGILVGGHEIGTINVNQTTLHVDHDATDPYTDYRRFDIGPTLGVGIALPGGVGLSLRAYQGLLSLTHDSKANIAHLYRQSLQASLTYQLTSRL
jgi:hypothetical protein